MEKAERAERKRRRRERLQEQGDTTAAELSDNAAGQSSEVSPGGDLASALPSHDAGAENAETAPPVETAPPPRPAAMAEIIGSGVSKNMQADAEGDNSPEVDPFFQRGIPRTKFTASESSLAAADPLSRTTPEPSRANPERPRAEPPPEPPPMRDMASRPQPQMRSSTGDSVLRALLLAALVVLAIDTYFIVRMNGVFDRLNATAAKPAASSGAPATGRPWIGIGSIKTTPFVNGGQPVTTVRFGNSGSEPAYDFRSNTVGSLRPAGSPPPDIPAQRGPVASAGVLVPNAEGILTFFANTRALTADEAGRVRSGQLVLWLAGRLDYRDARGKQHLTAFRYQYNPSLNSFVAAAQGNSAN